MRSMHSALVALVGLPGVLALLALLGLAACAPPAAPALALRAAAASAPADGVSVIEVEAAVAGAPDGVVAFALAGPGLLGATHAVVVDGVARVRVFAPWEQELTGAATTLSGTLVVDGLLLSSELPLTFAPPTDGPPVLAARTAPDRAPAGGDQPITVHVTGRRLASATVVVAADAALAGLPSSLALVDDGAGALAGSLVIPAPDVAQTVTLTLRADGVAPVEVPLIFYGEGEAAFDLGGTFAQVSYGVVEIGGLGFLLTPSTQCVVAPTFSLVTVEHDDTGLTLHSQTCRVTMGAVNVLGSPSTTTVGQAFVDAANAHAPAPLSFPLDDTGPGATFDVPADRLGAPLIVGADLGEAPLGAMPTDADDPRVRDHDGDGHPGVTIHNSSQGAQRVAYRTTTSALRGTIESSDAVRGTFEGRTETSIFGGIGISPTIRARPSPWFMARVDGGNAVDISMRDGDPALTCADVIAYEAELEALAGPPSAANACN